MKLKKHDFVEIEYTGRLEDGTVFDTTNKDIAKDSGLGNENTIFGPAVICLGEGHIIKGIEDAIIGKEPGSFKIDLKPENAFGKKDTKLLKLMPMRIFRKQSIQPFPGLEVNIDNIPGIIRSVSGGRVIVDFNHPLAGRPVSYEVKVTRVIKDPLEKAKAVFKNELNIVDDILEIKDNKLIIKEKIPEEVLQNIKKRVMELIPEIKDVVSEQEPKEVPKENS